jgi:hypothetical protein
MSNDTLHTVENIFADLLIFVGAMAALLVVLLIVISLLPANNPLKRMFTALSFRVGATAAAGALAIPIEPIPGLDVVYDIGAPLLLIWYWYKFFKDIPSHWSQTPPPATPPKRSIT